MRPLTNTILPENLERTGMPHFHTRPIDLYLQKLPAKLLPEVQHLILNNKKKPEKQISNLAQSTVPITHLIHNFLVKRKKKSIFKTTK